MSVIQALGRLEQDDWEFKASLDDTVKSSLKQSPWMFSIDNSFLYSSISGWLDL